MNMTFEDIKVGLKVVMTPKVGTASNWGPYIGTTFVVNEFVRGYVWLLPPEIKINYEIRRASIAKISKREFWDYFRLPSSHQMELDFGN